MQKHKLFIALFVTGSLAMAASSPASALSFGFHKGYGAYFNDGDKDGKLTRADSQKSAEIHFSRLDRNSDGKITVSELSGSDETRDLKFNLMLKRLDANGDEAISKKEFVNYSLSRFNSIDSDKDGVISIEERQLGHEIMRAEAMQLHFQEADTNGDGVLSQEEFATMGNRFAGQHFGSRYGGRRGPGPGFGKGGYRNGYNQ